MHTATFPAAIDTSESATAFDHARCTVLRLSHASLQAAERPGRQLELYPAVARNMRARQAFQTHQGLIER